MTRFPEQLARYRRARGWSQYQLAAAADFDHSFISRLEAGKRRPSRVVVEILIQALALDEAAGRALLVAAGYWPWPAAGPTPLAAARRDAEAIERDDTRPAPVREAAGMVRQSIALLEAMT